MFCIFDFERGSFHAATGSLCGAAGSEPGWHSRVLPTLVFEMRQQIAEMLTPKDSMIAPTATCAVAMSAALLLQIVQAPSVSWPRRNTTHQIDNFLSTAT